MFRGGCRRLGRVCTRRCADLDQQKPFRGLPSRRHATMASSSGGSPAAVQTSATSSRPDRRQRLSQMYLPTMKDTPTFAAESESHTLMLRAGLIRQSSAGIHSFLPFGLRALQKLEGIIDDEMRGIDAHKVVLPNVLPSDAWKKTGRWESTGQELYRLKDRKGAAFLLAPTHEEEITQVVGSDVVSTKQLPVRLYQIGKKFRDEARPRAGLLRGKEFVMKDLYTFDATESDALATYEVVREAYRRIFSRIGLPFAVAEADTGNIGGTQSHEFHFVSDAGEDKLLSCPSCGYTANEERARSSSAIRPTGSERNDLENILGALASLESGGPRNLYRGDGLSAEVLQDGDVHVVCVVAAGRKANETKATKVLRKVNGRKAALILDSTVSELLPDLEGEAALNVALENGLPSGRGLEILVEDILTAEEGDGCLACVQGASLQKVQAIEVGHTFYLGERYSLPLSAGYKAQEGNQQAMVPFAMGCFGIGLSRVLGAVVQISHDVEGIIWPESLAPYRVCIVPTFNLKRRAAEEPPVLAAASALYDSLDAFLGTIARDVVLDDRWDTMSFGQRIKEATLVGYPFVVVIGQGFLANGKVDIIRRKTNEKTQMTPEQVVDFFRGQ
ncbi:prolyl-tRNA synthetase [Hyaloraphidium curvatum]|nr:prolyl-tRNA synthetase [Hyaloraphidium curvatum]